MKPTIFAAALIIATTPAFAGERSQPGNTQGQGQSQGQGQDQRMRQGQSQRATGGSANNSVNVTQNGANGSGGGWSARGNTPDVLAGGVSGGNPCGLGAGAGGSGSGFGALLTFMWEGSGCEARQEAALLANMGHTRAGIERLCESSMKVRWAMRNVGTPCTVDIERWARGER